MTSSAAARDPGPPGPSSSASGVVAEWEESDTTVGGVLTEIDRLRRATGQAATRAAVVNLVVLTAVDAAAGRVVRSITDLGAHHPGRTTVIVTDQTHADVPGGNDTLGARVELRRTEDGSRALWWEVVVLHARGEVCHHLDSVVEPLLLHDLPTVLWLAGGTSRVDSDRLVAAADLVIVSGERAASSRPGDEAGLARDISALLRARPVTDLTWLALGPGRQALARLLDLAPDRGGPNAIGAEVSGPPWATRLLGAWLIERGLVAREAVLIGGPESSPGPGRLGAVIHFPEGDAVLDAGAVWPAGTGSGGPDRAVAQFGEVATAVPFASADTPRLLTSAVTRMGRDRRYEAAVSVVSEWRI